MTRIALLIFLLVGVTQFLHAQDTVAVDTTVVTNTEENTDTSAEQKSEQVVETLPVLRKVQDSVVKKMQKDKDFEYANDPAYWVTHKDDQEAERKDPWEGFYRFFSNPIIKFLAYILVGLVFLFILYRLIVVNNLYVLRSSKKIGATGDGIEEDLNEGNIDEKIRRSLQLGNYRQAVRYHYLKTLQILGEKGWIQLHAQSTNYDYVNQMRKHSGADKFNYLTRAFEYIWYGEFDLSENQYTLVQNAFQNFYNTVRS